MGRQLSLCSSPKSNLHTHTLKACYLSYRNKACKHSELALKRKALYLKTKIKKANEIAEVEIRWFPKGFPMKEKSKSPLPRRIRQCFCVVLLLRVCRIYWDAKACFDLEHQKILALANICFITVIKPFPANNVTKRVGQDWRVILGRMWYDSWWTAINNGKPLVISPTVAFHN